MVKKVTEKGDLRRVISNGGLVVDDSKWQELLAKAHDLDRAHVEVGVFGEKDGYDIAQRAAAHEFGTETIPERSFIRRTFIEKEQELIELQAKLCKGIVTDRMDVRKALGILGQWASTEIKKTVTEGPHIPPPLKPATIAAKGSDRPLVDTGQMINAVTYKVEIR